MPAFRPRSDLELNELTDDELIGHLRAARAARDREQAQLALRILVFGHIDTIAARVALKVPSEHVDLVAGEAFDSAFKAAFDGTSPGQFHKLLNTIVDRRVADYWRGRGHDVVPLDPDDLGKIAPSVESEADRINAQSAVDQVLDELGPVHRAVVELSVFDDQEPEAQEVADRINASHHPSPPMTVDNVAQIRRRFRQRLWGILNDGDT